MKNFALIFAFVPVANLYLGSGPEAASYFVATLVLLCMIIDVCSELYSTAIEESQRQIIGRYQDDALKALIYGNGPLLREKLHAIELFDNSRGAE